MLRQEKLAVWFEYPVIQEYVREVLIYLGVTHRDLHAGTSPQEREDIRRDCNDDKCRSVEEKKKALEPYGEQGRTVQGDFRSHVDDVETMNGTGEHRVLAQQTSDEHEEVARVVQAPGAEEGNLQEVAMLTAGTMNIKPASNKDIDEAKAWQQTLNSARFQQDDLQKALKFCGITHTGSKFIRGQTRSKALRWWQVLCVLWATTILEVRGRFFRDVVLGKITFIPCHESWKCCFTARLAVRNKVYFHMGLSIEQEPVGIRYHLGNLLEVFKPVYARLVAAEKEAWECCMGYMVFLSELELRRQLRDTTAWNCYCSLQVIAQHADANQKGGSTDSNGSRIQEAEDRIQECMGNESMG
ncbi:hypothetical protein IQ07DRAFT_423901 [Pyrenochaeta sp. DS3sAY3a]|nr:hypothetical protein IQ07DRAFT_423901 [Pyrenochaeta sp. DS3sAY3a]